MSHNRRALPVLLAALLIVGGVFSLNASAAEPTERMIVNVKRFGLKWKPKSPERIVLLRIWFSVDNGQTWKVYSETENPSSPAPVKVTEDGIYAFYTQLKDAAGNEEPAPIPGTAPKGLVVVDTKKPALVLAAPNNADVFPTLHDLRIEWNAEDVNFGATPIGLYASMDGGGTWSLIKKDLPNTGSYTWKLPSESSQLYRVRAMAVDLAGNSSEDTSDNNFTVDGKPPVSRVTGPAEAKSPVFDVTYNVRDIGGAGVKKVTLYYQMGDNKQWHVHGDDEDLTSPMRFQAPKGGKYGFKIVSEDRVGNHEPVPGDDTRPDMLCLMDAMAPVVQFTNFKGKMEPVMGGGMHSIQWKATDDNMAENPIMLEYTLDSGATWEVITSNYKNSGEYPWMAPNKGDFNNVKLRITALDVLGNKSVDMSDPFFLDSTAPDSVVEIVTWDEKQPEPELAAPPAKKDAMSELSSPEDLAMRVKAAVDENDLVQAQSLLDRAMKKWPASADFHHLQGRLHFKANNYNEAVKSYSEAVRIKPDHQDAHLGMGVAYLMLGNGAVTAKAEDKAVAYFRKAALEYEEAAKFPPDTWEEFFNLGYIYARLSNYDQAMTNLNKALTLDPSSGDTRWYLGQVYEKQHNLQKAAESYEKAAVAYAPGTAEREKAEGRAREIKSRMKEEGGHKK